MVTPNQNVNQNEGNQEHSTFYDQADGKFEKSIQNAQAQGPDLKEEKLSPGVTSDDDEHAGSIYSKNLMSGAEGEVRENEDSSLQDDSYAFDEANTGSEEYHDADDAGEDIDFDNDEDFIQ